MQNVSLEVKLSHDAKELLRNYLMKKGFSPKQLKFSMEDGAFLKSACISQELSEEIHYFLTAKQV